MFLGDKLAKQATEYILSPIINPTNAGNDSLVNMAFRPNINKRHYFLTDRHGFLSWSHVYWDIASFAIPWPDILKTRYSF